MRLYCLSSLLKMLHLLGDAFGTSHWTKRFAPAFQKVNVDLKLQPIIVGHFVLLVEHTNKASHMIELAVEFQSEIMGMLEKNLIRLGRIGSLCVGKPGFRLGLRRQELRKFEDEVGN